MTRGLGDAVVLQAIRDALDRAGLITPKTVDVNVGPKSWEDVFDSVADGSPRGR